MAFTKLQNSTTADANVVHANFQAIRNGSFSPAFVSDSVSLTDGIYDLGELTNRWRHGYFSGSIGCASLQVSGTSRFANVTITGLLNVPNLTVTSNLHVGGNTTLTGALFVGGNVSIGGNINVSGGAIINGNLNLVSNLTLTGALYVGGNASFTSNVNIGGDLSISGTASFEGNLTVGGAFYAGGNASIGGTLDVTGGYEAGSFNIKTRVLLLPTWNMNFSASGTDSVFVNHGLTFGNILSINGRIVDDAGTTVYGFTGGLVQTNWSATAVQIYSQSFDTTTFDSTSPNRGHIVITYAV